MNFASLKSTLSSLGISLRSNSVVQLCVTQLISLAENSRYVAHFDRQSFALRCSFCTPKFRATLLISLAEIRAAQLISLAKDFARQRFGHFAWQLQLARGICLPELAERMALLIVENAACNKQLFNIESQMLDRTSWPPCYMIGHHSQKRRSYFGLAHLDAIIFGTYT